MKTINIADTIRSLTIDVTKDWARQRRSEERSASALFRRHDALAGPDRVTIREAAFDAMDAAYARASDGGRLPVRPRQIMYAARPAILEETGKDHLDDDYFTLSTPVKP